MDITKYIYENILPLSVALWGLGFLILKPTKLIKDKYIPLILCILGVLGSFGILVIQNKVDITTAIIQGIFASSLAVFSNQLPKQLKKVE